MIYDVDVLVQTPITIRVTNALDRDHAVAKALAGDGTDISGIDYTFGEVVDIREVE